ncbi:MAG: lysophospholipid acyltransferase family protein [Candidatus Sumerlaeota bacterium]|nr:lysophospholipid acyltransferase family protein [Candidatus Sumerlaeota bacterium]
MRRARSNLLLAAIRLTAIVSFSFIMFVGYLIRLMTSRGRSAQLACATRWTRWWAYGCCRIAGYRVAVRGSIPAPGVFLAANHLGYADIIVLASSALVFFIAKSDVMGWPFFGLLARASKQIFVRRRKTKDMNDAAAEIRSRLQAGQSVCGFLEGTSSGGDAVLPFRSSFLQPAIDLAAPVIPVALKWSAERPEIEIANDVAYWKPEHHFLPHIWRQLGLRGLKAEIIFGEPIASAGLNRKYLAQRAQEEVEKLLRLRGEPDQCKMRNEK